MKFTMTTINITQQIDINPNTPSQEPLAESNSGGSSPGTSGAGTSGAGTSGAGTSGAGSAGWTPRDQALFEHDNKAYQKEQEKRRLAGQTPIIICMGGPYSDAWYPPLN